METKPAPFPWKPAAAFVLPFVVFAVLTSIEGMESLRPWYPYFYACKAVAILGVLWWGRRFYPAWSTKGLGWGLIYGLVGGILWIVLSTWSVEQNLLPPLMAQLAEWFNMPGMKEWLKPSSRVGYNPFVELTGWLAWAFVAVRLIGLVLIVPLMEELFWRGFLNRIIINEEWQQVPYGRFSRWSFLIITLAFVMVHTEWTAALVWVIGINLVYWRTKNLWACVVAHAASNAVLGYYILAYQQWHLW